MITQKELKKELHYNKDSGVFTRVKDGIGKGNKKGNIAGTVNDAGYIIISIFNKRYRAHRLAWLYVYGEMPSKHIDHINHIRDDNRICNLRDVSHKNNHKNRKLSIRNANGRIGVFWDNDRKRWLASIRVDGKPIFLGRFAEYSDAVNARKNAEILYGFHENHGKEL